MIVLGIYGQIEKKTISQKLGITISNLPNDWEIGIQEDIIDEINYRKYTNEKYKNNKRFKHLIKNHPLKDYSLKEILSHRNTRGTFRSYNSEEENLKELAKNLICMKVEIEEFDKSMIQYRNSTLDCPTCEMGYIEKFLNLFIFISDATSSTLKDWCSKVIIYNSDDDFSKPQLLKSLYFSIEKDCFPCKDKAINELLKFGKMIDNFLETEDDFWKLDYIINAISFDNEYNAYHLFKVYSIIEMLIIDSNKTGKTVGLIGSKLPLFMNGISTKEYNENDKQELAELIRVIRNKIGHGDFIKLKEKLNEYKCKFMKDFMFDEFERSEQDWIFLHICCLLDEILKDILWEMFNNKEDFEKIKKK
ncbi:hypothetical protein [Clostridium perfringens]|uniref:hypothetical protein n=1 Tax=Clostridium perfringens TaxID=1502 RepID=UPI0039ECA0FC